MIEQSERACLRTPEASDYTGIPESTLTKMRVHGTGPQFVRLGTKAVGYRKCDLDSWLAGRVCISTAQKAQAA